MRTPTLLAFALVATACSGSTGGGGGGTTQVTPNPQVRTERIVGAGGGQLAMNTMGIDTDVRLFSTGTPAQVWAILPDVYAELGIPLSLNNAGTKTLGNTGIRVRRSIGKVPLQRYVDCGSSGSIQNAETYEVNMSIVTAVQPNPSGGSVVSTSITGTGRNPVTSNTQDVRCVSLGNLEIRIRDMVQKRIEAM